MSVKVYGMLMLGIGIMMLLVAGYSPLIFAFLQCPDAPDTGSPLVDAESCSFETDFFTIMTSAFGGAIANPEILLALGVVTALGLFVGTFTGQQGITVFLVPFVLFIVINTVFFPLDFLLDQSIPAIIKIIIFGFLNVMLLLTAISFVRGSE